MGIVLFSNQTFHEGSPSPALEGAPHIGLTVPQSLSLCEYFQSACNGHVQVHAEIVIA